MAKFKTLRRLASDILKVGESKVKFDAAYASDFKSAVTREDVKALIKGGAIFKAVEKKKVKKQEKPKRQGQGRKRGTKAARSPRKELWVKKVRAQRDELKTAVGELKLDSKMKRKFYSRISGGKYKSRADLKKTIMSETKKSYNKEAQTQPLKQESKSIKANKTKKAKEQAK
ncbi:MAG: 50S ribosomal protein L19e [Euryarchaeota archaeon HGW-Euryarchaeota-1]|nr:MAG: 50S ribosomal protein L19e [Euryarchaeota archaeon HGW-Euryarchaeota-1]